jgi:high-affinity nickel-transport protein
MGSEGVAPLLAMVFVLGCRHGMDPDHLATIDGLTRFNALAAPRVSRWSGVLFSLGHGLVVTVVAALVAQWAGRWQMPAWTGPFGVWVSIGVLLALGSANLAAVWRTPADAMVPLAGLRSGLFARAGRISHPLTIAAVGALFALSFDTLSQAAVFSLAATRLAGWVLAVAMGLVFMLGMMASDGVNGLWIARLLRRADRRARIASRVMSLGVAALSFGVAGFGLLRELAPGYAAQAPGMELRLSAAVVLAVVASFLLAMRLAGRAEAAAAAPR